MFSDQGMILSVGDYAETDFNGRIQRVRVVGRSTGWQSQTTVMFLTEPQLMRRDWSNPWWDPWVDSAWFSPVFAPS